MVEIRTLDTATFRQVKPNEFLDVNPNGEVPAFRHGSMKMFEGMAIYSYIFHALDKKNNVLPKTDTAVAAYHLFAHWVGGTIDNLTATSSPVQRGIALEAADDAAASRVHYEHKQTYNCSYFDNVAAPFFTEMIGTGPFALGDNFSACDCILSYSIAFGLTKKIQWVSQTKH